MVPSNVKGSLQLWVTISIHPLSYANTMIFLWGFMMLEREGNTDLKGSHSIAKIWHLMMLVASQTSTISRSLVSKTWEGSFLSLPYSKVWPRVLSSGHWDLSSGVVRLSKGVFLEPGIWTWQLELVAFWEHEVTLRIKSMSMVELKDRRSLDLWGQKGLYQHCRSLPLNCFYVKEK